MPAVVVGMNVCAVPAAWARLVAILPLGDQNVSIYFIAADGGRKIGANMLLTIKKTSYDDVPAGAYKAIFEAITPTETCKGEAFRWAFQATDGDHKGKTISDLSDRRVTTLNKTGRWLSALSGKPLADGTQANPDDYVGKQYLVIVEVKNERSKIATFTPLV